MSVSPSQIYPITMMFLIKSIGKTTTEANIKDLKHTVLLWIPEREHATQYLKDNAFRQIMYDFTYTWNITKQNKWTKPKRGSRSRGVDSSFQLQNKWITGIKCTVWRI